MRLPAAASEQVREPTEGPRRGFGTVRATIGGSTWATSIFPESGSGCYVLPLRRAARTAEELDIGDIAHVPSIPSTGDQPAYLSVVDFLLWRTPMWTVWTI